MFHQFGVERSNFNVICAPITDLQQKKSDHNNGYYIVEGLWGSCFTRIATRKEHFEIVGNNNTYTKIPVSRAQNTYFVYVNYREGYLVNLPKGGIVVGMHEAQPHKIGGWWSQSLLVYSPTGEAPEVVETDEQISPSQVAICYNDKTYYLDVFKITHGFPMRYVRLSEDGYYLPKEKVERVEVFEPALNRIEDFFAEL